MTKCGSGDIRLAVAWIDLEVTNSRTGEGHGWRYRLRCGTVDRFGSSKALPGLSDRLEAALVAAIAAVQNTTVGQRVVVRTVEAPLVDGITRQVDRWSRAGWLNADGDPVSHRPHWEKLASLAAARSVIWHSLLGPGQLLGTVGEPAVQGASCIEQSAPVFAR